MIVRDVVTDALIKAGIADISSSEDNREAEVARRELRRMLKEWHNDTGLRWLIVSGTYPITERMVRVLNVRVDSPRRALSRLTRQEYEDTPTSTSPVSGYYFDGTTLSFWGDTTGKTILVTYERPIATMAMHEEVDAPEEWEEAIVYGLADRLLDTFPHMSANPKITARAEEAKRRALAVEHGGSIYFDTDPADLDITRYPYG